MIKISGTEEGLVDIKTLLEEGINVNVTLLFSLERCVAGLETYLKALVQIHAQGAVTRQFCIGSELHSASHRKILKPLGRFPEAG
jgi:transaldolase